MKVLVHYSPLSPHPSGVWWMEGTRGIPKSFYVDPEVKARGAVGIFGPDFDGTPLTLANWDYLLDRLPDSTSPFASWTVEDVKGDPRDLVAQAPILPVREGGSK